MKNKEGIHRLEVALNTISAEFSKVVEGQLQLIEAYKILSADLQRLQHDSEVAAVTIKQHEGKGGNNNEV